jgi:hypothetical protein
MPAITIQQAYALALGAYQSIIKTNGQENLNQSFSISSAFTGETHPTLGDLTKQNRLRALLSGQTINIGQIPANDLQTPLDPVDQSYSLVTSTTDDAGGDSIPDFITGGTFVGNSALSAEERNYHLTGRGIFKKLKK